MTNINRRALFAALVALVAVSSVGCALAHDDAVARLDDALKGAVTGDVHNAVMWVDAPEKGINQGFAHGTANADTKAAMAIDTPFLSASVGKLFVATAVMSLVEQRRLSLDDPMTKWIDRAVVAGLPVVGGDEALATITVRQLLAHKSGMPDYFSDPSSDGAPRLYDVIAKDRDHVFTRDALFGYARDHYVGVARPGEVFHYSDLNYDLLGLVLEGVTGKRFPVVVREQVLTPLGLTHTWYHDLEDAPVDVKPIADAFIGDVNMHDAKSLSADQAGGGLATTVADLRAFVRGLAAGKPVPLSSFMSDWSTDAMNAGIDVGLCVWRIRPGGIFFALGTMPDLVGHSGSTGVWAYRAERSDAVYVGAVSQSAWQEEHIRFLLAEVVPVVEQAANAASAD